MSSRFRVRQRLKGVFGGKKNQSAPTLVDTFSAPPETDIASAIEPALADQLQESTSSAREPIGDSVPAIDSPVVVVDAKSTMVSGIVLDNIALTLNLVAKLSGLFKTVPFIGPVANVMSEMLKVYQEVKDANDKREGLLSRIRDISHDLCNTVLHMEKKNHVDLIGRLKADIEAYAKLLTKASMFVKEYDNHGAVLRVVAHTQLGNDLSSLKQELDSFGARFRTNRLVDLVISQNIVSGTTNKIYERVVIEKIENWLGPPPDMKRKQHDTLELHKEGTGRWLLDGNEFVDWQDNPGALWICGPSGSGKSVLSSAVIKKLIDDRKLVEELKEGCINRDAVDERKSPAVAFFYFDFNNKEGHAVENALRRIVLQLSAHSPNGYKALDERHQLSRGQTLPTYQDLQDVLKELLSELARTYIILDALDECQDTEQEKLVDLISMLRSWTQTPLHLLITSQPRGIFTDNFGTMTCVSPTSEVTEEDIRSFVKEGLQSNPKLKTWFRLAACLVFEISRCKWQHKLEETLENLPSDLSGIYSRFLERIPKEDLVYVAAVLRWMMFSMDSYWGFNLAMIADAIAFDLSEPELHTYCPTRREDNTVAIVEWLEGLVTISDGFGTQHVVLAHASVQDYLLSPQFINLTGFDLSEKPSHNFLSQSCIGYLLHFADHPLCSNTEKKYPLAEYAARHWCHHLLHCNDQSAPRTDAMRLLVAGSPQYIALCTLRSSSESHSKSPLSLCSEEGYTGGVRGLLNIGVKADEESGEPLRIACLSGHTEIVRLLLENDANVHGQGSLLEGAARNGYLEIVTLLLGKGANINARSESYPYDTALSAACFEGHAVTVRLLLEQGAYVDGREGDKGGPLEVAASKGLTYIVGLLLARGANVNAQSKAYGSALKSACLGGHTDTVHLLLENGATIDGHEEDGSPLYGAVSNGRTDIVGLLLEKGAEANAHGSYVYSHQKRCGSALKAACFLGYTEIARLLLENGADANGHEEEDGSPLQVAASHGFTEIVGFLLGKGADDNVLSEKYGSALQAACREGHADVVGLLLENGANVDESSLQIVASKGHAEIVGLLLEKSANVNAQSKEYGSALTAASDGYTQIVRLLLEHGADVNGGEKDDGGPLHVAASRGHTEIVNLLLAKGADANTHGKYRESQYRRRGPGGRYRAWDYEERCGSALKAACDGGHKEIVRLLLGNGAQDIVGLLLEKGADANASNTEDGSALQVAYHQGHPEISCLLLENGADVNDKESLLQDAADRGYTEIIRLLLVKGVDINAQGAAYGSPLQAAANRGYTEIVSLLLEKGANANATKTPHRSALQGACHIRHTDIVRLLLEKGADVNGHEEENPLHFAAANGHTEIVSLLLAKGANANRHGKSSDSNWQEHRGSALKAASDGGHTETVRLLLEHGADINEHEEEGGSPLEVAASKGHADTVHFLLENGANVNAQSGEYGSALQTACRHGHIDVVHLLLDNGVDIAAHGASALEAAGTHTYIVDLLLEKGAVRVTMSAATGSVTEEE
ncbi:ankyrin repeat-containing domain protein [Mycena epipterygia]|nr:ankyrin repeat-containing domain protein [Mycena epipterygia]